MDEGLNSPKNVQTGSGVHIHPVPRVRLGGAVPPFTLYGFMIVLGQV